MEENEYFSDQKGQIYIIYIDISTFGSLAALELESGYLSGGQLFQGAVVNFREVVHK